MSDMSGSEQDTSGPIALAARIVAAYVSNNPVPSNDMPDLIRTVHATLVSLANGESEPDRPKPAVPVRKSIGEQYLICLEDGKKFKSLKRHLRTAYDMTPEEYREKWGLPADYPMVAPGYSRQRSQLAKKMGLGRVDK